jgi:hypothetical protein
MFSLSRYSYCTVHPHRSQSVSLVYDKSSMCHDKRYLTADVKMVDTNRISMVATSNDLPFTEFIWEGTSSERIPLGVAELIAGVAGLDLVLIDRVSCDIHTRKLGYHICHMQPTLDPLMVPVLKRMLTL